MDISKTLEIVSLGKPQQSVFDLLLEVQRPPRLPAHLADTALKAQRYFGIGLGASNGDKAPAPNPQPAAPALVTVIKQQT